MHPISYAGQTNRAVRHALALAGVAQRADDPGEVKAAIIAAIWQLEFAQQALCREVLQAAPVAAVPVEAVTGDMEVERLMAILQQHDRTIPELMRLVQLRQHYPLLLSGKKVAAEGDLHIGKDALIGRDTGMPAARDLLACCQALSELVESCRETHHEW